jgi:hypothetical protein
LVPLHERLLLSFASSRRDPKVILPFRRSILLRVQSGSLIKVLFGVMEKIIAIGLALSAFDALTIPRGIAPEVLPNLSPISTAPDCDR